MNILVCVKQVPDTTEIKIDPVTNTLIRAGVPSIVNPFDGYALEAAARIKDKNPDSKIVVLSMGPEQAKAALEGRPIPPVPPLAERCATAVRQFELAAAAKGERVAVLEARRHYCWYLKGVPHSGYYKEQIVQMNTLEDVYRVTKGIKRDLR